MTLPDCRSEAEQDQMAPWGQCCVHSWTPWHLGVVERGANHTWSNCPGWPPPYLHWVRSWTGTGHSGSRLGSQKLRPHPTPPGTRYTFGCILGRFTSSQASTVTLGVLRVATQASWGNCFKELDDGRSHEPFKKYMVIFKHQNKNFKLDVSFLLHEKKSDSQSCQQRISLNDAKDV